MRLFKSEEEKLKQEQEDIKYWEDAILKRREYEGKVGHVHQGLSYAGLWGVRDNGKMKYKSTKFDIHENKLLIQRNKMIIEYSNIKEIFQEEDNEAIILLNDDTGIPIKSKSNARPVVLMFIAFLNILNKSIEEDKKNNPQPANKIQVSGNSEDKFDKLIKLGEMHDKGLLSDEEFTSLKNELLYGNNENSPVQSESFETSENTCENCGADVSPNDVFCSECGTQINNN